MADHKVEITHPGDHRQSATPMVMNDDQLAAAQRDETSIVVPGGTTSDVEVTIHTSATPPSDG